MKEIRDTDPFDGIAIVVECPSSFVRYELVPPGNSADPIPVIVGYGNLGPSLLLVPETGRLLISMEMAITLIDLHEVLLADSIRVFAFTHFLVSQPEGNIFGLHDVEVQAFDALGNRTWGWEAGGLVESAQVTDSGLVLKVEGETVVLDPVTGLEVSL